MERLSESLQIQTKSLEQRLQEGQNKNSQNNKDKTTQNSAQGLESKVNQIEKKLKLDEGVLLEEFKVILDLETIQNNQIDELKNQVTLLKDKIELSFDQQLKFSSEEDKKS